MTTQKDCSKSNELFKIQSLSESIGLLIEFKHCFAHSSTYGLFNIIKIIKNQFKILVNNPSILNALYIILLEDHLLLEKNILNIFQYI